MLLVLVPQALAASGEVGSFAGGGSGDGGAGSEDGQLLNPGQIDVYDATGDIYVADTGNDRVQIFTPTEAAAVFSAKATVADPTGLAIDQDDGSVYVATETGIAKLEADLDPAAGWTDPGLTGVLALAVNPTSGDLLVAERETNTVHRFESDGTADGSFSAARPIDLAVDSTGDLLVLTSTGDIVGDCAATAAIERFSSAGASEGNVGGTLSAPGALAVDPDGDSILVAERVNQYNCGSEVPLVTVLDSGGTLVESVPLAGDTTYAMVTGLAAQGDGSTRIYVATKSPLGDIYGATKVTAIEEINPPEATIEPVDTGSVTASGATLSGTVDPNGRATQWRFQYRLAGAANWQSTAPVSAGSGEGPVLTGDVAISGLEASSAYEARLVANSLHGEDVAGPVSFQTDASAPTAITRAPGQIESTSAVLRAGVNANNEATTYFFEWGTTTAYGNSAPASEDGEAGGAGQPALVVESLSGLSPSTTYHYRVVATNATGTTIGDDVAFTTQAVGDSCPNAERRAEQNSAYLPDCRAYEMASPVDKNGTDVAANYMSTRASADGNSISFVATGAWDTGGTGQTGYSSYIYDRAADGWDGGGNSIYQDSNFVNAIRTNNIYPGLSDDFSSGVLLAREPHPAPGGTPGSLNLFTWQRDSNSFTTATPNLSGAPIPENIEIPVFAGATPDFEEIVYHSTLNLTPEATGSGLKGYHWDGEELHFVGILPGPGEVPATNPVVGDRIEFSNPTINPISADGSKVFFIDRLALSDTHPNFPVGPLYMRVDNTETVTINEEENPSETVPLGNAQFRYATEDGSKAFFLSDQRLVAADTDVEGPEGRDLYAYDTSVAQGGQNLSLVSDPSALPGDEHGVLDLLGASADGSRAYFVTRGEDYAASSKLMEIYVFEEGAVRHVAGIGVPTSDAQADEANYQAWIGLPQGGELADVSDDGRYLLFTSVRQQPDDFDNAGFAQLYRYDLAEDEVACVSCDPGAARATGGAQVHLYQAITPLFPSDERALAADGTVFFHSDDSLVPRDTNEATDAYAYDGETGRVSLLSSGKSPYPSVYAAAGKDGKTAFILTREQLVTSDSDDLRDLYAVRVNGGFREPPPPTPCEGVSCLGAPSSPPVAERSATGSFSGPGNRRPANCEKQKKKAAKATRKAKKAGKQTKQARKLKAKAKQLKEKARKCSAR